MGLCWQDGTFGHSSNLPGGCPPWRETVALPSAMGLRSSELQSEAPILWLSRRRLRTSRLQVLRILSLETPNWATSLDG